MSGFAKLIARTVAATQLGAPVAITMDGQVIRTRGTWTQLEDDVTFMSAEHIVNDTILRLSSERLPRDPAHNDPLTVDGQAFFVANAFQRGDIWLLDLTKRQQRL